MNLTLEAVMLQEPWTVDEVIDRGMRVDGPDEAQIPIFDSSFAYVVMRVHNGVADEVVKGPYHP